MIIIGYPGVGKSTLSNNRSNVIDFDSSLYLKQGYWEDLYVQKAMELSDKGNIVCVSSHKMVQELLKSYRGKVVVVYPSLALHDFWINKLRERYEVSKDAGDYRALQRCVSHYCEDILGLRELPFRKVEISSKSYDLEELLKNA